MTDERVAFFQTRYDPRRAVADRRVERRALGRAEGVNGYTTVDEARRLGDLLELAPGSRLLDVGAGRGWPGTYLARTCGCAAVLTDLPVDALCQGRQVAEERGVAGRVGTVCAEGGRLPFRAGVFDAVVHADVLC